MNANSHNICIVTYCKSVRSYPEFESEYVKVSKLRGNKASKMDDHVTELILNVTVIIKISHSRASHFKMFVVLPSALDHHIRIPSQAFRFLGLPNQLTNYPTNYMELSPTSEANSFA